MQAKQPVIANNLVQYHVSQTGRVDANQPTVQRSILKPVVNYNTMPQVQPIYYYQNTLPNILQNTLPQMSQPFNPGYVSVPSYQYVPYPNPYSVPQFPPQATLPAQYVYYNQQQQLQHQIQLQQKIPLKMQQPQMQQFQQPQLRMSASQDQSYPHVILNNLSRATTLTNLNNPNNFPNEKKKILQNDTDIQFNKPRLVEPLSLSRNNQQFNDNDSSILSMKMKSLQKTDNSQQKSINSIDKYKDLIYKPRHLASRTKDLSQKSELLLNLNEEDENENEAIETYEIETSKSSLPTITSQKDMRKNLITPILSSRPTLVNSLKLPVPREIVKEKALEDIIVLNLN